MKISDLNKELGITSKEFWAAIEELGLAMKKTVRTISEEEAAKVRQYFVKETAENDHTGEIITEEEISEIHDLRELVDEEIHEELEKEVRKAQKIKKAGSIKEKSLVAGREAIKKEETGDRVIVRAGQVELPEVISVKEFSEKIGIPAPRVIAELMKNGMIVTINHKIDFDTASLIAEEFKVEVHKMRAKISSEDLLVGNLAQLLKKDDSGHLDTRPPIISVMGHVDHGKTKILDWIRKSNVIATEAGGITQRIGAYQVERNGKKMTFLDTPGHEAFTAMRARGAQVTDIAILVVAADESVKPQTEESYNHAKEAGIPVIVAINKVDKPEANIDKVKGDLAKLGLIPEEWGGGTMMLPVSAMTGQGMEELLEAILLVAEMEDLKADYGRPAVATVIESNLDPSLGPVATVLVNAGILHLMDSIVVGQTFGRVKVMLDHNSKKLKEAGPSAAVRIAGMSEMPMVGDILQVIDNVQEARQKAEEVKILREANHIKSGLGMDMTEIITKINEGQLKYLKLVVKADTKGSLEAIRASIAKIKTSEIDIRIIHSGIGNITETDVIMAGASGGIVMGFHVDLPVQSKNIAAREKVEVRIYSIIYKMLEDIEAIATGMLDPELREVVLGQLKVLAIFFTAKKEQIVGGRVIKGKVTSKVWARVLRNEELMGEIKAVSLKKENENVSEIKEGHECGVKLEGDVKIHPDDILEFYTEEKIDRKLN